MGVIYEINSTVVSTGGVTSSRVQYGRNSAGIVSIKAKLVLASGVLAAN